MMAYLRLLRPKQWSKNLLVFAAILFTNKLTDMHALSLTLMAFFGMCFVSSTAYILNDLQDVEKDRAHPRKRLRPIASGQVSKGAAMALAVVTFALAAVLLALVGPKALAVVGLYILLQVFYNLAGKRMPVMDVFIIGTGFVLRAVLGAAAIGREISVWLLLCTGGLALLLGFAKRRHEFILQGDNRSASRASLAGYSRQALDALVVMTATGAALCYAIYALESPTAQKYPALFITILFVYYGICRYVLIVFANDEGGEPETLLFKDKHILASVVLFVVSAIVALSVVKIPLVEISQFGGVR
jgi:4-hydroxybenzoate polyprenyltransferase